MDTKAKLSRLRNSGDFVKENWISLIIMVVVLISGGYYSGVKKAQYWTEYTFLEICDNTQKYESMYQNYKNTVTCQPTGKDEPTEILQKEVEEAPTRTDLE